MKNFRYLFIGLAIISLLSYFDVGQSDFVFYSVADPVSAAIAGGASLLSSIFGGLFGSSAQESANETNLQIARETNSQNYSMFHEQQNWNEKMYHEQLQDAIGLRDDERAYNTPEQIAQRLRDAGINPSAILGSSASSLVSGTMQSPPSVQGASPNPAVAARVEPYDYSPMMEGISRSINSYFENANQDADLKLKQMDLYFKFDEKIADLNQKNQNLHNSMVQGDKTEAEKDAIRANIKKIEEEIDILRKTKNSVIKQADFNAKLVENQAEEKRESARKAKAEARYQELVNEAFPGLNELQKKVLRSQISLNGASAGAQTEIGKHHKAMAKNVEQQTLTEKQKTLGQILENGIKANQFTLGQLGMSQAELDALKAGKLLETYKNHPNYRRFRQALQILDEDMPTIPLRLK